MPRRRRPAEDPAAGTSRSATGAVRSIAAGPRSAAARSTAARSAAARLPSCAPGVPR